MAIDTASKRFAMLNAGWRPNVSLFPPSGTVSAENRAHLLALYNGIPFSTVSPPVFSGIIPDVSYTADSGLYTIDAGAYFTGATSYSILPAIEAGWSFDILTGILTSDTDIVSSYGPYVVTGANISGSVDSNGFTVDVTAIYGTLVNASRNYGELLGGTADLLATETNISLITENGVVIQTEGTLGATATHGTLTDKTSAYGVMVAA